MVKFLPKNLDLQKLLSENPPPFKYHLDHFVYLCSLLYELPAKKKDIITKKGYIPLHAHLLKRVNNNYKKYFTYLIEQGVIECDNSYIVGEKSKGYKFAPQYIDMIQIVEITKHTLTKNLKKVHDFDRDMQTKYDYLCRHFNDGLTVDFSGAKQKLLELYQKDKKSKKRKAFHKFNTNLVNLIKLHKKEFYFTVDVTSHRLHTLLTVIKKQLRPYITYGSTQLVNIDIQCSQPTLSLCLLDPEFYSTELKPGRVNVHSIDKKITDTLPIQTIASYVNENQDKFTIYRELVLSDFYTAMADLLKQKEINISTERDTIKKMMFLVLFSSNQYLGGTKALPKRIFKELFPEVYEVFKMYKSTGHEKLPVLLQKIESKLILDKVTKNIYKALPEEVMYTIHDSIVVNEKIVDFCKEVMSQEALTYLGFVPKLKIESWINPTKEREEIEWLHVNRSLHVNTN